MVFNIISDQLKCQLLASVSDNTTVSKVSMHCTAGYSSTVVTIMHIQGSKFVNNTETYDTQYVLIHIMKSGIFFKHAFQA